MKLEIEQIYKDGKSEVIGWTNADTITLFDAALQFTRRFTAWILTQPEEVQTETAIMFGDEFQALADALKIPEVE